MTGLSLALPRAASLSGALMAGGDDPPTPAEVDAVRAGLADELSALAVVLPPGERLRLDAYRFTLALHGPQRLAGADEPFAFSPRTCRRAVGLAAVARCLGRPSLAPAQAVADILTAGVREVTVVPRVSGLPWWAPCYEALDRGGRATVEAEAVTWATQLWTALSWDDLARPVVGGADDRWACPGGALTLRGHADVRVRPSGPPALLVLGSGSPPATWRDLLGFPALVAALAGGPAAAPGRVIGLWPASGQVRILPAEATVLTDTAEAVVAAAAAWVDHRGRRRQAA